MLFLHPFLKPLLVELPHFGNRAGNCPLNGRFYLPVSISLRKVVEIPSSRGLQRRLNHSAYPVRQNLLLIRNGNLRSVDGYAVS